LWNYSVAVRVELKEVKNLIALSATIDLREYAYPWFRATGKVTLDIQGLDSGLVKSSESAP
jgi:hypothetical protein